METFKLDLHNNDIYDTGDKFALCGICFVNYSSRLLNSLLINDLRTGTSARTMGTRAVAVAAAAGAAGMSGEAGLAGVPRLLEDLARLSEDKDSADIVFLLGRDETPVYAHRIILQARLALMSHYL